MPSDDIGADLDLVWHTGRDVDTDVNKNSDGMDIRKRKQLVCRYLQMCGSKELNSSIYVDVFSFVEIELCQKMARV